ncbi:MAG: hypothetical protein M1118_14305 [Chloroflexi bacterium]|nr:hypothetical protein [Chloroflexota bacterium]
MATTTLARPLIRAPLVKRVNSQTLDTLTAGHSLDTLSMNGCTPLVYHKGRDNEKDVAVQLLRLSSLLGVGVAFATLTAVAAAAPSPHALTLTGTQQLTGSTAGAFATYAFSAPAALAAPAVSVIFSPSSVGDGSVVGFLVLIDGVEVTKGSPTGNPGQLSATLPGDQTGMATVEVYSYAPEQVSFTVSVTGVPANVPNGPAGLNTTVQSAASLNGSLSETLPANTGGSFAFFNFPTFGASPPSFVELSYSPANALVSQAVGFNVYDEYGNVIASAQQPAGQNSVSGMLQATLSRTPGEPLAIQVYNYAPGVTMTYRLSVSGVSLPVPGVVSAGAVLPGTSAPAFTPFWVENFVTTSLWSGPNSAAVNFGMQPQFSSFLVVQPQQGPRLYVYNPQTENYAYIDADAVGPSGPPG